MRNGKKRLTCYDPTVAQFLYHYCTPLLYVYFYIHCTFTDLHKFNTNVYALLYNILRHKNSYITKSWLLLTKTMSKTAMKGIFLGMRISERLYRCFVEVFLQFSKTLFYKQKVFGNLERVKIQKIPEFWHRNFFLFVLPVFLFVIVVFSFCQIFFVKSILSLSYLSSSKFRRYKRKSYLFYDVF